MESVDATASVEHLMVKRWTLLDMVLVCLLAAVGFLSFRFLDQPQGQRVRINVNGKPFGEWPFPSKPETLAVGTAMDIVLSSKGARVLRSTCSRQVCVHQGLLGRSGQTIVCVPNRTVIEITGQAQIPDAIAQ